VLTIRVPPDSGQLGGPTTTANGAVALRALQLELEEQRELARFQRSVRAILWRAARVEVVRDHCSLSAICSAVLACSALYCARSPMPEEHFTSTRRHVTVRRVRSDRG
jgi:hypothetical protein